MKKTFILLMLMISTFAYGQMENPVSISTSSNIEGNEISIIFKAAIEPGWHLYSTDLPDGGPTAATVTFETLEGAEPIGKLTPGAGEIEKDDAIFGMKVKYFENSATFTQKLKILDSNYRIEGYLRYGVCNDENCLPPTTYDFKLNGKEKQAATAAETKAESNIFTDNPLWKPVVSELKAFDENSEQSATRPLWMTFLLGFGGGLLALLTPCVWPIIPMTVSFFLKRADNNRGKALKEAILYGCSIVAIYLALGLAVTIIFGASALNALSTNAIFNLIFFLMLLLFGASFLGGFELTLPSSWTNKVNKKARAKNTSGLLSIFLMAFTLSLVSFSCTGPIIGFLLVEVSTTGSLFGPAIGMFGFALALALPFTIFALFPSMLKSAPRSGGWMNSIKVVLGFIELALSLKFLSVADLAYGWGLLNRPTFLALWIVIFASMGFYLVGKLKFPHDDDLPYVSVPRYFLAMISFAFAIYMVPGLWGAPCKAVSAFAPPMYTQDFSLYVDEVEAEYHDYEQGMQAAMQAGKPVLVDFTGYGCVNCREMEASVWTDDKVRDIMREDYVLVSLYVDDKTPLAVPMEVVENGQKRTLKTVGDKWSFLQRYKFGANAQPFYVILDNEGNPLSGSYAFDKDVDHFLEFLNTGKDNY